MMASEERMQNEEQASKRASIDAIGIVVEKFDRPLTDDHKIKMFAMTATKLKKLHQDLSASTNGHRISALIFSAISNQNS